MNITANVLKVKFTDMFKLKSGQIWKIEEMISISNMLSFRSSHNVVYACAHVI